jgi:hypothetical protein
MNELFFEPQTTQYGSHMVMTNVHKTNKTKYINIDTRFREEYNYLQVSNYNITLPERITDVKSMKVVSAEIPITFYNISSALGNNYFYINNSKKISIPDGQYDINALSSAISSNINSSSYSSTLSYMLNGTFSKFVVTSALTIDFAVNIDGTPDKFNFKSKLGWLLGFRNPTYVLTSSNNIISESLIDINGPRYLYLAIEEFNKGNQSSFVPALYSSLLNKNIIARISLNNTIYNFGNILPTNNFNGLLLSDIRSYTGKIDLLKLNIQLLNENGLPVNLNGMDFSFCLEVIHE